MSPTHHSNAGTGENPKRGSRPLLTILLTLALLATTVAPTFASGVPDNEPIADKTGVVLGDITYQGGTVQFDRGFIVGPGATLRFLDTTVQLDLDWRDCPEACTYGRVDLFVAPGGTLEFHNSTVTSTIDIDGVPKRWTIQGEGGIMRATGSVFERGQQIGFELPAPQSSQLYHNDFTDVEDGLSWIRGASLDLRYNQFRTYGTSVYLRDVQAQVIGNVFGGYETNAAFMALDIIRSSSGQSNPGTIGYVVAHNHFENRLGGIGYVRETPELIYGNTFHDVKHPFKLELVNYSASADEYIEIRNNTFSGEIETLLWAKAVQEVDLVFQDNDILSPVCFVANDHDQGIGMVHIAAENNWWGSTEGPQLRDDPRCQIARGPNKVTVTPWANETVA